MNRHLTLVAIVVAFALAGCASEPGEAPTTEAAEATGSKGPPFTAEQIRDAWGAGLTLKMRTWTPEGETWERWTVLTSDADGAEIEFVEIDADGESLAEPVVRRSGWTELRDHANFPPQHTTREDQVRDTPLGMLDGWLYRVEDPEAGTVTEFFFASSLPGAPVHMQITKDGQPIHVMSQEERSRS